MYNTLKTKKNPKNERRRKERWRGRSIADVFKVEFALTEARGPPRRNT